MYIKKTYNGVVPNGKVLNSKSESLTDTYSCDYMNKTFTGGGEWKLLVSSAKKKVKFDIPECRELYFECDVVGSGFNDTLTMIIPYTALKAASKSYRAGSYFISGYYSAVEVKSDMNQVWLNDAYHNGTVINEGSAVSIFYR